MPADIAAIPSASWRSAVAGGRRRPAAPRRGQPDPARPRPRHPPRRRSATRERACRRTRPTRRSSPSTCRSSAPTESASRSSRNAANSGSSRPGTPRSPRRAPRSCGRASSSGRESDGSGSSTGSADGFSVPSGCIHSTTLPAFGPSVVCRYASERSSSYALSRLRLRAGQRPVAQVHDRRTRDVVGVVRPLSPRVGRRVEGAAADPLERAAGPARRRRSTEG